MSRDIYTPSFSKAKFDTNKLNEILNAQGSI